MSRFLLAAGLVGLLAGSNLACGQAISRESLISSFQDANPEASDDEAGCVVDDLMSRYSDEELEAELSVEPISAEFEETQFRAMFACGIEGDVAEQIRTQLEGSGVSEDDAPCVADALMADPSDDDLDVLLSGEITDEFFAKFLEAMDGCGALD